jgi:biotin carboxyl carrier protein
MEAEMRLKGPGSVFHAKPWLGCQLVHDEFWINDRSDIYASTARDGLNVWVSHDGYVAKFTLAEGVSDEAGKEAVAPMTGKVVAIPVEVGQTVKEGDTLAILEAMKMEYRLEAEADGEVAEIGAEVGELVDLGHVLVRLK